MCKMPNHRIIIYCLIVFVISAISSSVLAETASLDEMTLVCRNWLAYMTFQKGGWADSNTPTIETVEDIVVNDTVVARCFMISPVGYVVVPVLKELPPIKVFSDNDAIDINDPEGLPLLLREVLSERLRLYVERYGSLESTQPDKGEVLLGREHRSEWDRFLVDEQAFQADLRSGKAAPMEQLGPLLTSTWHQSDPYNALCPIGDGGRCVVGCVATAAAQILVYHRWPPEGTGSHMYYWPGDNSCGGSTAGMLLTVDYFDPYDWDNIPDNCGGGCTPEEEDALAELNYEVGVAFNMHYGRCGSGAYTSDAQTVFPRLFRYHDWVEKHDRPDYFISAWSDMIRAEIEADRPFQYRINLHSIVGDGWLQSGTLTQVHMNYGWGGSHNYWYTIDNLYCPWEGCSPSVEFMLTKIEPDRGVVFSADTTWGQVPLTVSFDGSSPLEVDTWTWDFGNGDSASVQSPIYSYETPGRFDVILQVDAGGDIRTYSTTKYITALADSLIAYSAQGEPDSLVEVTIYARFTVPLRFIKIPVEYPGSLNLTYNSFSTAGCLTDYFDQKKQISLDPSSRRSTFAIYNNQVNTPDLEAGFGPILKIYFNIPASAQPDETASIIVDGYLSHAAYFSGPVIKYAPISVTGTVCLAYICGDANYDEAVNLLDITHLINYLYKAGPAPMPIMSGDADGNGPINLLDVTRLINYLYKGGPAPVCQ